MSCLLECPFANTFLLQEVPWKTSAYSENSAHCRCLLYKAFHLPALKWIVPPLVSTKDTRPTALLKLLTLLILIHSLIDPGLLWGRNCVLSTTYYGSRWTIHYTGFMTYKVNSASAPLAGWNPSLPWFGKSLERDMNRLGEGQSDRLCALLSAIYLKMLSKDQHQQTLGAKF